MDHGGLSEATLPSCCAGLAILGGQPTPVHGLVKALPLQQEDDRSGYIAASYGHGGLSSR